MTKAFAVLQGSYKNSWCFSDLRKVAENIMVYLSHKINGYALLHYDEKLQLKEIIRSYKEKNYRNQDGYNSSMITMCSFSSYPKGKEFFDGDIALVCFVSSPSSQSSAIIVVWVNDRIDKRTFQRETEDIIEILSAGFSIDNIFADCMDCTKSVDFFVQGVSVTADDTKIFTRSNYENKIAQNINQYINYNGKFPFLFAYTSIKKIPEDFSKGNSNHLEFVNLDLLDRDLEEYFSDQAWNQCYNDWIEKGIIAPLPSC